VLASKETSVESDGKWRPSWLRVPTKDFPGGNEKIAKISVKTDNNS
jgi:hypothetical protein